MFREKRVQTRRMIRLKKQNSESLNNLPKYILISISLLLMGCEGFKLQGTMCDSMQPGQVSTECHAYSEEEAAKASESPVQKIDDDIKYKKSKPVKYENDKKD